MTTTLRCDVCKAELRAVQEDPPLIVRNGRAVALWTYECGYGHVVVYDAECDLPQPSSGIDLHREVQRLVERAS